MSLKILGIIFTWILVFALGVFVSMSRIPPNQRIIHMEDNGGTNLKYHLPIHPLAIYCIRDKCALMNQWYDLGPTEWIK